MWEQGSQRAREKSLLSHPESEKNSLYFPQPYGMLDVSTFFWRYCKCEMSSLFPSLRGVGSLTELCIVPFLRSFPPTTTSCSDGPLWPSGRYCEREAYDVISLAYR